MTHNRATKSRPTSRPAHFVARSWKTLPIRMRPNGGASCGIFVASFHLPAMTRPQSRVTLLATLNLSEPDSQGILETSIDPGRGWTRLSEGKSHGLGDDRVDVSEIVRGSSTVYVRAQMRGRDDHDSSAMAQFLRTSTLSDGRLELKTPHVFELRTYDRAIPIVTATLRFNDGWSRQLWIRDDGTFELVRKFGEPGRHTGTITATAAKIPSLSRTFDMWVNSTGWVVNVVPTLKQFQNGEPFRANGRLVAVGPAHLSGMVDYVDGSGERELIVGLDGSFVLHHLYRTAGKYFPRVTIKDKAGHMATAFANCNVVPRAR